MEILRSFRIHSSVQNKIFLFLKIWLDIVNRQFLPYIFFCWFPSTLFVQDVKMCLGVSKFIMWHIWGEISPSEIRNIFRLEQTRKS